MNNRSQLFCMRPIEADNSQRKTEIQIECVDKLDDDERDLVGEDDTEDSNKQDYEGPFYCQPAISLLSALP